METIFDHAVISRPDRTTTQGLRGVIDQKTKPKDSLGRLEELAVQIGAVQGSLSPTCDPAILLLFAGDHGIAVEGVSAYPSEVTGQMVLNFLSGGAAANVFARVNNVKVIVADAGVAFDLPDHRELAVANISRGTKNAAVEDAMTMEQTAAALAFGHDLAVAQCKAGIKTILLGEMGIGNTSSASLLTHALTGRALSELTGHGTGIGEDGIKHKLSVLEKASSRHLEKLSPLQALAAYGGYEIAAMAGALIGAASQDSIVVVDGFIAGAAALVALKARPEAANHCVFAHRSQEPGHDIILDTLQAAPLLDLQMRLGEGTGALLALPLLRSACAMLNEMATFESAGVSEKT